MKFSEDDYLRFDPCGGDDCQVSCRTVKLVVARNKHACFLGTTLYGDQHMINPGDRYRYEKALIDGDYWGRYRVCIPCMDKWFEEIGLTSTEDE